MKWNKREKLLKEDKIVIHKWKVLLVGSSNMGNKEVSFSYISKTGLETTVKSQQDPFIDFQIISGRKKKGYWLSYIFCKHTGDMKWIVGSKRAVIWD